MNRRGDGDKPMSTSELFVIFGPLCAGAIVFAIAFEIARVTGAR